MKTLQQVTLFDTQVTETGLEQLRGLEKLNNFNVEGGFVGPSQPVASNPEQIEPASPEQVARLDEALWWLPTDTESLLVTHGPFSFPLPTSQSEMNVSNQIQNLVGMAYFANEPYQAQLAGHEIALFVEGSRRFGPPTAEVPLMSYEGCQIVVFEHELGEAGNSLMAALTKDAAGVEVIQDCEVARFDFDAGESPWTIFVAQPRPDVLVSGTNRDYLSDVLSRMTIKATERALPEELPEWKHLDRSAREWAMRHFSRTPGSDPTSPLTPGTAEFDEHAVGFVYSAQGGDVAKVIYLSDNQNAEQVAKRTWHDAFGDPGVEVRQLERGAVQIDYPVHLRQSFSNFYYRLMALLGHGIII
jgi:hypothetical protein